MPDIVIVRAEDSAAYLGQRIENRPGPQIIPVGSGGKIVRMPNGKEVQCGGELLRQALRNGGTVIGDAPVVVKHAPSIARQKNEAAADLKSRESAG